MAYGSRGRGEAPLMAIAAVHAYGAMIVIALCLVGLRIYTPWEFKLILLVSCIVGFLWYLAGTMFDLRAWENGERTAAEDIALFVEATSSSERAKRVNEQKPDNQ
jgi:hypothetical protein